MRIHVASPFAVFFDEEAVSISGVNATGPFDVLPQHHNFITLVEACDLIIQTLAGTETRIKISGGVMHVKADTVRVFLNV